MKLAELQNWLLTDGIRHELQLVARLTATADITNVLREQALGAQVASLDWDRTLLAASILAQSNTRACHEAVLRIATGAIILQENDAIRDAGALLFEKLSNHRAVDLAVERENIRAGLNGRLGVAARLEAARRQLNH